jgi:hypothetical protein
MRLNPGRVKPAGVAAGVLWDVVVWILPGLRELCRGVSGRLLERVAVAGESPVRESAAHGLDRAPE